MRSTLRRTRILITVASISVLGALIGVRSAEARTNDPELVHEVDTADARAVEQIAVGMSEHLGLGLQLGSSIGLQGMVKTLVGARSELALAASFGAGIAQWGLGTEWRVALEFRRLIASDGVRNALIVGPGIGYGAMEAETNKNAWIRFSPLERVQYITGYLTGAWVHEYRDWSLEVSLRPGASRGLTGGKNAIGDAVGEYSMVMTVGALARF